MAGNSAEKDPELAAIGRGAVQADAVWRWLARCVGTGGREYRR